MIVGITGLYCDDGFDFCEADFGIYSDDKCDCRSSPRFDAGDKCKCSPVPGVRFSCENCDSFDLCEGTLVGQPVTSILHLRHHVQVATTKGTCYKADLIEKYTNSAL